MAKQVKDCSVFAFYFDRVPPVNRRNNEYGVIYIRVADNYLIGPQDRIDSFITREHAEGGSCVHKN